MLVARLGRLSDSPAATARTRCGESVAVQNQEGKLVFIDDTADRKRQNGQGLLVWLVAAPMLVMVMRRFSEMMRGSRLALGATASKGCRAACRALGPHEIEIRGKDETHLHSPARIRVRCGW